MIFRRKNQIDISINENMDSLDDSEFSGFKEIKEKRNKRNIKEIARKKNEDLKKYAINQYNSLNLYVKNNVYHLWKIFLTSFTLIVTVFAFVMAFLPFSFFLVVKDANASSTLTNFFYYNGSSITLSIAGIIFAVSLILMFLLWVAHIFMYKKYETIKYVKNEANTKRQKAFLVIKYLSWLFLITGFLFLILIIIIPPNISSHSQYLSNMNLINNVISHVDSNSLDLVSQADKEKFLSLINQSYTGDINDAIISAVLNNNKIYWQLPENSLLFFKSYEGGTTSLNTVGIVFLVFSSVFIGLSFILFTSKKINAYFTYENLEKIKKANIQFNFADTKESIMSINNKLKGVIDTSQQKYYEFKNKDTFRKYKKRLVEEGKDTNSDKFTTDVNEEMNQQENRDTIFSVLKNVYREKSEKAKKAKSFDRTADKNRMKPPKPEIAVPDEELDELIDSLDIK